MSPLCRRQAFFALIAGIGLGYSLHRMGFTDFGELHRMLVFADLRLFQTFLGGVALCALGFRLYPLKRPLAHKPIHPGVIPGGVLFGIGWALTGCCPSVPLVQLGEGKLYALATFAGISLGTAGYRLLHARFFRWDAGSCAS